MTAGLVGLSGAAILSVYAVGYFNTSAAADQLAAQPSSDPLTGTGAGAAGGAPAAPRAARGPFDSGRGDDDRAPQQNVTTPTPSSANPGGSRSSSPQQQASSYRDGTFVGVGNSRHGGMQVSVVIKGGRLVSASVSGCGTRYPCSKVNPLASEVVSRQGAPVDYVSGATDSSMAYIQAVRSALSQASASAS